MRTKPLYVQVRDALFKRIASGELGSGDRLPTEDALMRTHGVSRITVRQAFELLQHEGLVERFAGRGTFVTSRPPTAGWTASSIDDVLQLGAETLPEKFEWKAVRDPVVASRLAIAADEKIYRLRAVRVHRGIPVYFIEAFVPAHIGRRLHRDDLASAMLISVIEQKLGIPIVSGLEEITAGVASQQLARHLRVAQGKPLLILDLTYSGADGKPIEFARAWYRADMFRRRNVLSRGRSAAWRPTLVTNTESITEFPLAKGLERKRAGARS
jgi:GntR family transcriptional regulator